jgi:hypothetical protein
MLARGDPVILVWYIEPKSVFGDLRAVAAKLSAQENRPTCVCCGKGHLVLVEERPDPNFGILGVVQQTLKCDAPECGKVTIV